MAANNIEDAYILSPMQQGILFHALYAPESDAYFEQVSAMVQGDLDLGAFERAWQQVVDRHPILRSAFAWENLDQPLQVVGRRVKLPFQYHDWCEFAAEDQQLRLKQFLQADRSQGFKLSRAPLTRITLLRLAEDRFQCIWSFHQLLIDGWSAPLLLQEVFAFYEAFQQGRALSLPHPRPYRDYLAWLEQQDLRAAEDFWRQTLAGFTTPTLLQDDLAPEEQPDGQPYGEQQIKLSPADTAALQSFAQQHQLTLNTLVQGAWALLLSRYSGEADVLFGVTVAGRPAALAGVEQMIGLFINTLPLRAPVPRTMVLRAWLKDLQARQAALSQYEYSPLVRIHGWSELPRNVPLFESILIFKNYPFQKAFFQQPGRLRVDVTDSFERSNYPLTLAAIPGQELLLQISYNRRRFSSATVARLLRHCCNLLAGMAADPEQALSAVPILSAAEQAELSDAAGNATQAEPHDGCVHELFERQAERNPAALAIAFEGTTLTYQELNARSNQIAHGLRGLTDERRRPIAIVLDNPPMQVLAMLAVLKAGHPFVCLDSAYPPARFRQILAEVDPAIVITESGLLAAWQGQLDARPAAACQVVVLDDHADQAQPHASWFAECRATSLDRQVDPADLAYIVYTSGSTGTPKGIMQSHRSFCQFLAWQSSYFQIVAPRRVAQWAATIYDAAYCEIFGALCFGATLYMARPAVRYDPVRLVEWLKGQRIALLQVVPSFARQILQVLEAEYAHQDLPLPDLEQLLLAGEVLPVDFARTWLDRYGRQSRLFNLYGPSETVLATYYAVEIVRPGQRTIPIGRAIAGRQILVLNREQQLCPVGVQGEIYIRSRFLTAGYYQRPAETAQAFIQNPLHQDYPDPVYRTGDLGRVLPDGNLVFGGRRDQQVKIRGMRVELTEIEAVLARHPLVDTCAVLALRDDEEDQRLIAAIVLRPPYRDPGAPGQRADDLSQLHAHLKQHLPAHMCPATFVFLDTLPRTPTGKIDRTAIRASIDHRLALTQAYVAPRTELEAQLANLWQGLLRVERVGVHDNIFDLGAHSLLVTQAVNKLRRSCGVDVPLRALFERPTIAELAGYVEERRRAAQAEQAEVARLIAQINQLSDQEAQALLQQKLSAGTQSPSLNEGAGQ